MIKTNLTGVNLNIGDIVFEDGRDVDLGELVLREDDQEARFPARSVANNYKLFSACSTHSLKEKSFSRKIRLDSQKQRERAVFSVSHFTTLDNDNGHAGLVRTISRNIFHFFQIYKNQHF